MSDKITIYTDQKNQGDVPDCPHEYCQKLQAQINQYCKNLGYPPGRPVLSLDNGELCQCKCGQSSASQQCLDNISKQGGVACSAPDVCVPLSAEINHYCAARNIPAGTPVPQISEGKVCYCCCDTLPLADFNTVQVGDGNYLPMDDLDPRMDISCGTFLDQGQLVWNPVKVHVVPGLIPPDGMDNFLTIRIVAPESTYVDITVPQDHLFLLHNGRLKPASLVVAGDMLMDADGKPRAILFICQVFVTRPMGHVFFSGFDGQNFNGHLYVLSGVVSADFSVQLEYAAGRLPTEMLDKTKSVPDADGNKYLLKFQSSPDERPYGVSPTIAFN